MKKQSRKTPAISFWPPHTTPYTYTEEDKLYVIRILSSQKVDIKIDNVYLSEMHTVTWHHSRTCNPSARLGVAAAVGSGVAGVPGELSIRLS